MSDYSKTWYHEVFSACRLDIEMENLPSGLDADTEEHILKTLFAKNGLFRQRGTTVLLATYAIHRLSYSDHIVAMKSDGTIMEQGTLEELKAVAAT
ncbi:hypothetical protein N7462_000134 [Penicillium macrosclerotiorum]|uniref:uncharacterized protein n=1 Tax=Penicillium macrosclerotiorum TaxID=303699 RepID=UPI0025469C9F|nr:uncharacterized protein N7462_000134 [Penicillium macrosclerotiorum]KAJ5698129.1 hypothetical protein N7462_000134 [Penicillium macrosclerotiorum]